jgi:hypothetical protein
VIYDEELLEECGLEELYGGILTLPQTIHADKLRKVKTRIEELHRTAPEEFYRRKSLIQQAIKEREKGHQRTMPELTLEEMRDVLKFTERSYP